MPLTLNELNSRLFCFTIVSRILRGSPQLSGKKVL